MLDLKIITHDHCFLYVDGSKYTGLIQENSGKPPIYVLRSSEHSSEVSIQNRLMSDRIFSLISNSSSLT